MKVCRQGLESIWINHANGEVRMCGWTRYVLGSLLEHSIEELWRGDKAEEFRKTLLDGSYLYCDKKECPYCANENVQEICVEYNVPDYPKYLSLSYEEQCNYQCVFCRNEHYIPTEKEKDNIKIIENEIDKFVDQLDTLSTNGVGEVFCSPSAMNYLSNVTNPNMRVSVESNGSLFNKRNWKKIENLKNNDLTVAITVHSFQEKTYQYLSGTTMPMQNIIDNLYFVKSLRDKGEINRFELATVICEKNFREIPEFVQFALDNFNPDSIRLRFFKPYGVQDRSTEWFLDVRNPYHPSYNEFVEVMNHPILNNPKVWKWQGDSVSDQKEHPFYAEHRKSIVLSNILQADDAKEKIANYFCKEGIGTYALYGNSIEGRAFAKFMLDCGMPFEVFYDSFPTNNACVCGYPVVKPRDNGLEVDAIIITAMSWTEEIEAFTKRLHYTGKVISMEKLINEVVCEGGMETGKH